MRLLFTAIFAFAAAASFASTNTFEGNLTLTSTKNGTESGKVTLAVKNDQVAIEPGGSQPMVLNVKTGDFQSIVKQGDQKMIIKLNVSVLSQLKDMPGFLETFSNYLGATNNAKGEVKMTEEVKTISGFKATKYTVKDETSTGTLWLTKDIQFSVAPLLEMMKLSSTGLNTSLKDSFPLEGTTKDNKTGETTGFKVVAEKKLVDNNLFTFPPEMAQLDMTPLVKQMIEKNDPAQIKALFDQFLPK